MHNVLHILMKLNFFNVFNKYFYIEPLENSISYFKKREAI